MKPHLSTRFVFAFLLLLIPLSTSQAQNLQHAVPEEVGMSTERLTRLSDSMKEYVDLGQLPGNVILVLKNGKIVFEEANGFQDIESSIPMGKDALFRIASQSKAIISAGILILQEEGKLIVRDPVSRHLPEYAKTTVAVRTEDGYDVVDANRQITIRDLLTHTAGIDYGYGTAAEEWKAEKIQGWYFAHQTEPIRETVRRMAALPMARQPGEAFVYGYNTDILGAIIEVASGQTLDVFLKDRIFDPLHMENTFFYVPPSKAHQLTTVYALQNGELTRAPDESKMLGQGGYVEGPRTSFSGGAGLVSTARDYARFLQMVLNGGNLDGNQVLSPVSVESMLSDHISHLNRTNGTGMGLGFGVITHLGQYGNLGSVGEFSWGGAYHSSYFVSQSHDMVVVYFTQVIPAQGINDHSRLRSLTYQSIIR
ncbi:MAG: beta-lactamase family protein [Bacteroidetes Order II. Incertae sedis bacterium]|jgi:CubicO group peptidase (beta-lactamase class C family)|nr:beta-lactamase family protein [Bacteroidetes Order II. bacterium]MBT4602451.1 beta-lactamase family protein [Bacteroidetes Order II. bacterium]MBT5249917.1 beta-lactamase family protein [Bacteroidetes Order II. bacterium]MBT6425633.1 beta-lactamase family protein [Bacteroidetes Order II. bacterium]MBT6598357.1 beta-lactamase family protein [Bacteroidetes Order II. bacterium]